MNVVLTGDFESGVFYQLTIAGITDCTGNEIASTSITFGNSSIPQVGDLIITEIMADPAPVVGLPEAEFVEIYNSGDQPFDLSLVSIADLGDTVGLPSVILMPQEYIVLTSTTNNELFTENSTGVTGSVSYTHLTLPTIYSV